ncbi:hypothetical protein LUZ60_010976 [Juncus effusus]|nr:hypothetical protein LUZ60_010976 [Juncus effusus]
MAGQETSQVFHMHYSDSLDDKNFALHGRGMALLLTLLCILLFFTLMYLYFRWACSTYPTAITTTINAATATNITSRTQRNINDSLGLDTESINSISVSLYEGGEPKECAICLGGLKKGEKVKILPICSHAFHLVCIDTWLRTQPSCPLCRNSISEIEFKDAI